MATPGIGTIVMHHTGSYDEPALVVMTHNAWNSNWGTQYGLSQPSAGQVYIVPFALPDAGNFTAFPASEGTSSGNFSLLSTEVPDS